MAGSGQSQARRPSVRSRMADSGRLGRGRAGDPRRDGRVSGIETNAGGRAGLRHPGGLGAAAARRTACLARRAAQQ